MNLYKAEFTKIGKKLNNNDWEKLLRINNLKQNVNNFYNIIDDNEQVPDHKHLTAILNGFHMILYKVLSLKRNCIGFGFSQIWMKIILPSREKEQFALDYLD